MDTLLLWTVSFVPEESPFNLLNFWHLLMQTTDIYFLNNQQILIESQPC